MWVIIGTSVFCGITAVGLHHVLTKPSPFHIDVEQPSAKVAGVNILPLVRKVVSILPESTRKYYITKRGAPHEKPRDRYDFTDDSPYRVTELETGKMWKVAYDMELTVFTTDKVYKQFKEELGLDFMSEEFGKKYMSGAQTQGDTYKDVVKKDLETIRYWAEKREKGIPCTNDELKELPYFTLNMIVLKLNSGSLLLYAPVAIRDEVEFGDWLDGLGRVEWLVVASAVHTMYIKAIVDRYPAAKIIGPPAAEAKVRLVTNLPRGKFDFHSTNKKDLLEVNSKLMDENCELFNIAGDVVNSLVVKYKNTLLECDLVYGHHNGDGFTMDDGTRLRKCAPEDWIVRLLKFTTVNKPNSVHGFLPNYRYWMQDPNSLGFAMYDAPASDGSSCTLMAKSLREVLKMEFDSAVGVHINEMSGENFRKSIDKCWSWLDGQTLIDN